MAVRIYWICSIFIFILLVIRAIMVPLCHDEMATFVMYVQNGEFWPYHSIVDANNHFLNSFLSHHSYQIFGFSALSLRIPNLLFFPVYIYGGFQFLKYFEKETSKYVFIGLFLFAFNWVSFFALSRGYGISMALLVMALLYFSRIVIQFNAKYLFGFILFSQAAISANLTLLLPVMIISLFILFLQFRKRIRFDGKLISAYIFHIILLFLWIDYSFFLKNGNALYYGEGENYWEITFVSLSDLIFNFRHEWFHIVLAFSIFFFFMGFCYQQYKSSSAEKSDSEIQAIYLFLIFVSIIISVFFLHFIFGINYPKDRTGMFFYLIFILVLVFSLEEIKNKKWRYPILVIPVLMFIHFFSQLNFQNQPLREYAVFPERFYTAILSEQKNSEEKLTISGHRIYELTFSYFNYLNDAALNPMDDSEEINTYSDFMITMRQDENYYKDNYQIIDSTENGFLLLKRKNKAHRRIIDEKSLDKNFSGHYEFFNLFQFKDSVLSEGFPLLVEMEFDFNAMDKPFDGFIVLDIKDEENKLNYFKRIPLHWLKFDWAQTENQTFLLMTDNLPKKIRLLHINLWNTRGQFISFKLKKLRFYRLIDF